MMPEASTELTVEGQLTVRKADLCYVNDDDAGYRRKRWGRGFTYLDENGDHIDDPELRKRFEELVIPPAWTDVWICPDPRGHIQVTGRDEKGRKQYIYHPRWEEVRQETKFNKLILFAESLPALRSQVDQDLRLRHFPRAKIVALLISLLDQTLIRVGNSEYAKNNDSYGLTTMREEHVSVNGSQVNFEFMGKSGKEHEVALRDRRLAQHVGKCQQLPGQHLFQYKDEEGRLHVVTSTDVNEYLSKYMHEAFSAKDFRTWGGTVLAAQSLMKLVETGDERPVKNQISNAVKEVAQALGNTVAVCRAYYIHPAVLQAYEEGKLQTYWQESPGPVEGLAEDEARVLRLLREDADS
jgi:DNA topoisomerase-1